MNRVFAWPVGQNRRSPFAPNIMYAFSATVGGALTGVVLAALIALSSELPKLAIEYIGLGVSIVAVSAQLLGQMFFFPQRRAQVPREWLRWGQTRAAVAFGLMIGSGVATWLHYAVAYVLIGVLLLSAQPWLAVAAGAAFGFARGAGPLTYWLLVRSPDVAARYEAHIASVEFRVLGRVFMAVAGAGLIILAAARVQ